MPDRDMLPGIPHVDTSQILVLHQIQTHMHCDREDSIIIMRGPTFAHAEDSDCKGEEHWQACAVVADSDTIANMIVALMVQGCVMDPDFRNRIAQRKQEIERRIKAYAAQHN